MPSSEVMKKFHKGKLRSGSKHGTVVTDPDQAVAIYYSEKREEKKRGGYHPRRKEQK